jgi:hypothetical protein
MRLAATVLGLCTAVAVALSLILTASAFAEFASESTSGKATGESVYEGGGLTIKCPSAEAEWKLSKSPSPTELQTAKPSKGVCTATGEGIKEPIAVEESECEGEVTSRQKGVTEHAEILGTILKTCTTSFKFSGTTCEIKAEPSGNKEIPSGFAKNEGSNIVLTAEAELTVEVKSVCPGKHGTIKVKEKGTEIFFGEHLV